MGDVLCLSAGVKLRELLLPSVLRPLQNSEAFLAAVINTERGSDPGALPHPFSLLGRSFLHHPMCLEEPGMLKCIMCTWTMCLMEKLMLEFQSEGVSALAKSNCSHARVHGDCAGVTRCGRHLAVLLSADSAVLGVWDDGVLARHKVITGYTVRRKAGKAQLTYLRRCAPLQFLALLNSKKARSDPGAHRGCMREGVPHCDSMPRAA